MLDGAYLAQDLRKGRSNTITTYPYGTAHADLVSRGAGGEITITPSLIQDTLTIEQSKMLQSVRTDEMPSNMVKRVNQVSFVQQK